MKFCKNPKSAFSAPVLRGGSCGAASPPGGRREERSRPRAALGMGKMMEKEKKKKVKTIFNTLQTQQRFRSTLINHYP